MIEVVPHMPWYRRRDGLRVRRDNGQDEIYLTEDALDANDRPTTVRMRIGFVLQKPGAPINFIAEGLSESVKREVRLAVADRQAKLHGGEAIEYYGLSPEGEIHGISEEAKT